jgi:hypothetical protein
VRDPKRLLSEQPTDLERTLLYAASKERPSFEHRQQLRRALGLVPGRVPLSSPFWSRATKTAVRAALVAVAALVTAGTIWAVTTGHRVTAPRTGQASAFEGLAGCVLALADTDQEAPADTSKGWTGSNENVRGSGVDRREASPARNPRGMAGGEPVDGGFRASPSSVRRGATQSAR